MNQKRLLSCMKQPVALRCFDEIDSTNREAKDWVRAGSPLPAAVLADGQTAGRGRRGCSFFSPQGGLYLSLIVASDGDAPGQLTTLAAVAVRRAVLQVCGIPLSIKWVNDLLHEGHKVAGILVEGVMVGDVLSRAVIGIGLNLGPADFPEDIAGTAGTLYRPGQRVDRERLAAAIMDGLLEGLPCMPAHIQEYSRHCITLGRTVRFDHHGRTMTGQAREVLQDGSLSVDTPEGPLRLLAGEVSVRGADGRYF